MLFFRRKQTQAVVTQVALGEDGKPGRMVMDGVASLDAREGVLFGKTSRWGRVVLILPLAEVAMATITEKPK